MKTRDILTLSQLPGITQARLRVMIPQARVLPLMDEPALKRLAESHRWLSLPDAAALQQARIKAEELRALSQKQDIHILSVLDQAYPQSLAIIKDAPPLLFLKGNRSLLNDSGHQRVAVIGARKILPRTQRVGKTITHHLLKDKIIIVSGLALGSDSLAHRAAVDARQPTIAVLAGGLDRIHPISNQGLAQEILHHNGLLLSETPVGVDPIKQSFVLRNRIITALSSKVIVLQAAEASGAMHAVRFARQQGKPIACPSPTGEKDCRGNAIIIERYRGHLLNDKKSLMHFLQAKPAPQRAQQLSL